MMKFKQQLRLLKKVLGIENASTGVSFFKDENMNVKYSFKTELDLGSQLAFIEKWQKFNKQG
jgi:hypothetical protein